MRFHSIKMIVCLWVLALGLCAGVVRGQLAGTGVIVGTVTDPSRAAVPGAAVVMTNTASGVVSRTQTNAEGAYQVPYLLPGVYVLEISHAGFKTYAACPSNFTWTIAPCSMRRSKSAVPASN